jgi:hypothetical protein
VDQIAHHFVLAVDGDPLALGELEEIDAMSSTTEADGDAAVPQSTAPHAIADAERQQQIDRPLFEDTGPHAIDHVVAAAVLDDDRIDPVQVQ